MLTTADKNRKMYERNGVETIVDSDGVLRLNKKHIKEGLRSYNFEGEYSKISFRA